MGAYDQGKAEGYKQGCGCASAADWDAYSRTLAGTPEQGWIAEGKDFERGFVDGVAAWKAEHPYSVLEFGSHPDENNDDCYMGRDFATIAEARAAFSVDPSDTGVAFLMLDGPDVNEVRKVQGYRASRRDDNSEWRHEHAMQAGMVFGCDGYNDAMGY